MIKVRKFLLLRLWFQDDIDFSKPMGQSYYFIPKELTNLLPQEKVFLLLPLDLIIIITLQLPLNPNPKANPLLKPEANENKKELPKSSDYFEENKLLRLKLEEQVKLYEKVYYFFLTKGATNKEER